MTSLEKFRIFVPTLECDEVIIFTQKIGAVIIKYDNRWTWKYAFTENIHNTFRRARSKIINVDDDGLIKDMFRPYSHTDIITSMSYTEFMNEYFDLILQL